MRSNSGQIPVAKIPNLPASKITTGTLNLSRIPTIPGNKVSVNSAGFNGNLATTDNDVQKVAQKLDDLEVSTGSIDTPLGDLILECNNIPTGIRANGSAYPTADIQWRKPAGSVWVIRNASNGVPIGPVYTPNLRPSFRVDETIPSNAQGLVFEAVVGSDCLLYTSPSPRD